MKHVFIIHSHTTLLTAKGVIEKLNIPNSEVIFLMGRNYETSIIDIPYTSIDANDLYYSANIAYTGGSRKEKIDAIKKVDLFVTTNIREVYILYVPNFCMAFFGLLYTHSLCQRVAFIQESAAIFTNAYVTKFSYFKLMIDLLKNIVHFNPIRTWFPRFHYRSKSLYKQKYLDSYALNNKIFQYLPSRNHIIKWPQINIDYKIKTNAPIFIADGFVKNQMVESTVYRKNIEKLIATYHQNDNYVKFHPIEEEEEKQFILQCFEKLGVNCEVIPNEIPMELVFVSYKQLYVYGLGSSLCFFAKDLGHHVECHDEWLENSSKLFRSAIEKTGLLLYSSIYK